MATTTTALSTYMTRPESLMRFVDVIGNERNAKSYIQSVMLAVANSDELQKCTHESILSCALRSATLELSCDPALRQAQLVPFNKKIKIKDAKGAVIREEWQVEATLIVHYAGLGTLIQRTGKYKYFNVSKVYKGYIVEPDLLSGLHTVRFDPKEFDPNVKIGWIGSFETTRGYKKTVYMTVEEIHEHAAKFSKNYNNPNSKWKDPKFVDVMEMKTVYRALAKWADMSGSVGEKLAMALQDDPEPEQHDGDVINGEAQDVTGQQPTEDELRYLDACEMETPKHNKLGKLEYDQLLAISNSTQHPDLAQAAQIILAWREAHPQPE